MTGLRDGHDEKTSKDWSTAAKTGVVYISATVSEPGLKDQGI